MNSKLVAINPTTHFPWQLDRDFAGRQSLGSREEQQDSYAFSILESDEQNAEGAKKLLLIVADGMGGYAGGREASSAAVSGFVNAYFEAISEESPSAPICAVSALKTALLAANHAVDRMILSSPDTYAEAGTTLFAAVIAPDSLSWISVGDSPLFLWRKGKLLRLNADHSMRAVFAEKVAAGEMLAGDVATHPERNALLSALIGLEIPCIDEPQKSHPLEKGDLLLAASDGIFSLSGQEISETLQNYETAPVLEIVRTLLAQIGAKAIPSQDNTTIAIVRI